MGGGRQTQFWGVVTRGGGGYKKATNGQYKRYRREQCIELSSLPAAGGGLGGAAFWRGCGDYCERIAVHGGDFESYFEPTFVYCGGGFAWDGDFDGVRWNACGLIWAQADDDSQRLAFRGEHSRDRIGAQLWAAGC